MALHPRLLGHVLELPVAEVVVQPVPEDGVGLVEVRHRRAVDEVDVEPAVVVVVEERRRPPPSSPAGGWWGERPEFVTKSIAACPSRARTRWGRRRAGRAGRGRSGREASDGEEREERFIVSGRSPQGETRAPAGAPARHRSVPRPPGPDNARAGERGECRAARGGAGCLARGARQASSAGPRGRWQARPRGRPATAGAVSRPRPASPTSSTPTSRKRRPGSRATRPRVDREHGGFHANFATRLDEAARTAAGSSSTRRA